MMNPPLNTGMDGTGGIGPQSIPFEGLPEQVQELPSPPQPVYINVIPDEEQQKAIVSLCSQLKRSVQSHGAQKKKRLQRCYDYSVSKLSDGDLLPTPNVTGSERDRATDRPQVFYPMTRQQLKTIYSSMRLTLFPNDENFFQMKSRQPAGVQLEDHITEALKYIYREQNIVGKIGGTLWNLCVFGFSATFPTIRENKDFEWSYIQGEPDPMTGQPSPGQYQATAIQNPPTIDIENFNPLNFYIDPIEKVPDRAKWVNIDIKKVQELKDSPYYFNTDKLKDIASKTINQQTLNQSLGQTYAADMQYTFQDSENSVKYDLYYFPFLEVKAEGQEPTEYRNMIVGIAGEEVLCRFHPNTFPRGRNPVTFYNWMTDPDNIYSVGVAEDLLDLQKLINIIANYKIESLARIGNRFAVKPECDLTNFFGVAGGVLVTEDPKNDVSSLTGDFSEIAALDNTIGVLKAEGQIVSGAQNPFQGSSQVDYKKTATEVSQLAENSISILREVIEHVSQGMVDLFNKINYLIAEIYTEPIMVPVSNTDPRFGGESFIQVDLSVLKQDMFTFEMTSVNSFQSKQAQINALMQLAEMIENPEALAIIKPFVLKMANLMGVKDGEEVIDQILANYQQAQAQAMQQQAMMAQAQAMGMPPGPAPAGPPPV